jgi:DNA-binding cell septation regulator SpoVG
MQIRTKIYPIDKPKGKTVAFANVTVDNTLTINSVSVIESEKGTLIAMPSTKGNDGKYHNIAYPMNNALRSRINETLSREWAQMDKGAEKAIWAVNATAKFNSDCAIALREGFRGGKLRLLVSEYEAEETLAGIRSFQNLNPPEKTKFLAPYVQTTLAVGEIINLQHEESGGLVKISEKNGMRKDRYSSLSYNYFVACQLEIELQSKKRGGGDFGFCCRAPKIRGS